MKTLVVLFIFLSFAFGQFSVSAPSSVVFEVPFNVSWTAPSGHDKYDTVAMYQQRLQLSTFTFQDIHTHSSIPNMT